MGNPYKLRVKQLEGLIMNTDLASMLFFSLGGLLGFFIGYAKGHEHGKIAGRIARNREQRALSQVGR